LYYIVNLVKCPDSASFWVHYNITSFLLTNCYLLTCMCAAIWHIQQMNEWYHYNGLHSLPWNQNRKRHSIIHCVPLLFCDWKNIPRLQETKVTQLQ